jgi:hypothetical protein
MTFGLNSGENHVGWEWKEMRILGLRLPLRWFAHVRARCGEEQGRYRFDVSARLPLIGLVVAYSGWLEPVDSRE